MGLRQLLQRPAENAAKPGVDVAKSGLPRFHTDKVRHDAAVDLAANPLHRALANALFIGDQNVAGGGADNFDQRVWLRTGADGAHMAVECAAGDGDGLRQAQARGPFGGERADRDIRSPGIAEHRVGQALVDYRVEFIEETGRRQSAPAFMPKGFVPGAAAAATNILRAGGPGKQGRHPVAQLNPRRGGLGDGAVLAGHVEDLGPEPFAGVDTADIAGVILFARQVTQAGNLLRLLHRGMVLPQHEHGVGVAGELVAQRQHVAVGVDGRGGGAGAVNADTHHGSALFGAKGCEDAFQRGFH